MRFTKKETTCWKHNAMIRASRILGTPRWRKLRRSVCQPSSSVRNGRNLERGMFNLAQGSREEDTGTLGSLDAKQMHNALNAMLFVCVPQERVSRENQRPDLEATQPKNALANAFHGVI